MSKEYYDDEEILFNKLNNIPKELIGKISGTATLYPTSTWYPFFNPLLQSLCDGYKYIHFPDDESLDIVPDYDTSVVELNHGMEDWDYNPFTALKVETQEEKYEWFLSEVLPKCHKWLVRHEDDNTICVYDQNHLKRVYYVWMTRKLGQCAKAHGGASKCAPLKGFYIYLAKKGIRIYQGSPKAVRDAAERCGGTANPERIVKVREKLIEYANSINHDEHPKWVFDKLTKLASNEEC